MAAAGSSNDRQGGAPKPRFNQWVHIAFTHNVFQDRALRQGTTLNLDYVPAVEIFALTSVVGAYKRSLTELHKGPTIDYGEPVAVNPWRRSQVVPLTMRVPYRNAEKGFAFTQSKLVCAQKVVDDILSRIQTHDRLLNSWILYWATELRFLIEALRLKNDSLRDIIDNPVRIAWIRRITFMLMMTFGGTTDALLDRCKSSFYDDREWKIAMAIPYFPRAADRVPESTTQLIKRPEDRHSDVTPVLSRCQRMVPWSPNSGRRLDTARHWTSGNDMQHIVHMHSFEQKWSYTEFEGVPKMVAEVDATNLDSSDVAMDTLQISPSPSAARTQRRASALTTSTQGDECDSIKWGQTYPAGYKKPLVTFAIGCMNELPADMHVHWMGPILCVADFKKEVGMWASIARNTDDTDEQALMSHLRSGGTFPSDLDIGAELEPFSCFTTNIDCEIYVHIALPATPCSTSEFKSEHEFVMNAIDYIIKNSDDACRLITMRPPLSTGKSAKDATDNWVEVWKSISCCDWSTCKVTNVVVIIDKSCPVPSPVHLDKILVPLADNAMYLCPTIPEDKAEIRADDGLQYVKLRNQFIDAYRSDFIQAPIGVRENAVAFSRPHTSWPAILTCTNVLHETMPETMEVEWVSATETQMSVSTISHDAWICS